MQPMPCLYSGECIVDLERGAVSEKWGFQWDREARSHSNFSKAEGDVSCLRKQVLEQHINGSLTIGIRLVKLKLFLSAKLRPAAHETLGLCNGAVTFDVF